MDIKKIKDLKANGLIVQSNMILVYGFDTLMNQGIIQIYRTSFGHLN